MAEQDPYEQPREWWDPLAVVGVAALVYGLLTYLSIPGLHPSIWDDVAVAAGLRPPANPFPGLYRILVAGLFSCLPAGTVLDAFPHLGRGAIALSAMFVYLVFRDTLPATLRLRVHMARIGANVGRISALFAAVFFVCADPVWRAGQCFTPVSLFLLLVTGAIYLFFRFLRKGAIPALYGCCAVLGVVSAESTLGFLLAFLVAAAVVVAVAWAQDPDVPLVNPLVDDLVREVVFKRLTYIWAFFFVLAVGVNVWLFVVQGGLEATGHEGVLGLLFDYFRGAWEATRDAATGSGWLFFALLALLPFVLALKLLPRAWDDDKFLPWIVGVVFAVVGAVSLSQLAGAKALWFWTWLGAARPLVPSDTFLAFILMFDVAALAFALAVFGVDANCRNYRRIAQQQFPEAMLAQVPSQMVESLGKARRLRKALYWSLVFVMPFLVLPGRWMSTERGIAEAISASVEETLRETEGCEAIFTDGSFDGLLELEALRRGRSLPCLSLMAANTPRERILRERAARDDEDRELLKTDAATALRTWVATKPERLEKSAVQIGFEMWKRVKKPLPPLSGLVALPGGVSEEERTRALAACSALGDKVYELAKNHDTETITDLDLRRKFPFVLWRLSRLAQMRSRAADEAGKRSEAFREAARADELDEVNAQVQKMKRDMNWLKKQNGGQLSPREGLVIGLARADFALAGRYAAPVLAADPDDPRANFALGMMYFQDEQYSRSEQYLAKCLKRRPDEPAVLNNLAIVQMKLGKLDEAEQNVRRVLEKHPDISEAKKTLDRVLKAKSEKPTKN